MGTGMMLRAWHGDPRHGVTKGRFVLYTPAQPHRPLHGDMEPFPGLSPAGTGACGGAVLQGRAEPGFAVLRLAELNFAMLYCAEPGFAVLCLAEPSFATPSRALPCFAARGWAGGWAVARCHPGKYFAGAVAAGPRPPAAVGAPADPGAGARSQLPLPPSSLAAASSASMSPTWP